MVNGMMDGMMDGKIKSRIRAVVSNFDLIGWLEHPCAQGQ